MVACYPGCGTRSLNRKRRLWVTLPMTSLWFFILCLLGSVTALFPGSSQFQSDTVEVTYPGHAALPGLEGRGETILLPMTCPGSRNLPNWTESPGQVEEEGNSWVSSFGRKGTKTDEPRSSGWLQNHEHLTFDTLKGRDWELNTSWLRLGGICAGPSPALCCLIYLKIKPRSSLTSSG